MTPTLKTTTVTISYSASDGYSSKETFSYRRAKSCEQVLIRSIDELARLATLFGFGERAATKAREAVDRTTAALAEREART